MPCNGIEILTSGFDYHYSNSTSRYVQNIWNPHPLGRTNNNMSLFNLNCLTLASLFTLVSSEVDIDLSDQDLSHIPPDIDIAVSSLNLDSNRISILTKWSLYNFTDLRFLYLQFNAMSVIEDGAFDTNSKLEVLKLSNNVLTKLPSSFGAATYSLQIFKATLAIKPEAFKYLNFTNFNNILWISLGNNKGLPGNVITKYSKSIEVLGLFKCNIETIPDLSIYVPHVRTLGLQQNALANIHGKGIGKLMELMNLRLDSNQLQSVPDLFHLPLRSLKLTDNPLECNQSLCWLRMWVWFKPGPKDTDATVCAAPDTLRGRKLCDVDPVILRCYQGNKLAKNFVASHFYGWKHCNLIMMMSPYTVFDRNYLTSCITEQSPKF